MASSQRQPTQQVSEVLAGIVERATFHNEENGFCVLRVKARGHRDLVTVVGHAATISAGEWLTVTGEWFNDRKHGQQFKARFLKTSAPTTAEGIEKYLASGMIPDPAARSSMSRSRRRTRLPSTPAEPRLRPDWRAPFAPACEGCELETSVALVALLGRYRRIHRVEWRQNAFMLNMDIHPSSLDFLDFQAFEPVEIGCTA
jgi:hypothetical protein